MVKADLSRRFEYENGFYATAGVDRLSKLVTHLDLYRLITNLAGDVIECGVFKGNSLFRFIKLRALLENAYSRRIFGFDIFGTFPGATRDDDRQVLRNFTDQAGDQSISEEEALHVLRELNLDQNVQLIKGDVIQTIPDFLQRMPQIKVALLHIDVDLYEPTRAALENFFPRVVKGGIVILDDFGAFPGANDAIDEYFRDRPESIRKLPFSNNIAYVEKETR